MRFNHVRLSWPSVRVLPCVACHAAGISHVYDGPYKPVLEDGLRGVGVPTWVHHLHAGN